ncbi:MAG: hypothetical protein E7430_06850 [Ruminococcaceae bacterium]|nr:hypothetical protein [Oscillospiraceae bacterium]
MKEYLVQKKKIKNSDGNDMEVSYCIVSETLVREDGFPVCECYGISIQSEDGEKSTVRTVSVSLRQIEDIIHVLAQNDVLPVQLSESLENCLERL